MLGLEEKGFDQPVKNYLKTYDSIQISSTGQGDDYTMGFLLDYVYSKNYYKIITIDLNKQQASDADPKAVQQINFTGNLERDKNTTIFFIIQEAKETIFRRNCESIVNLFLFNTISK